MSKSRPISATDHNNKGWVVVDWTQVRLEAKRVEREKAKAEKAECEAKEERACKEERRCRAEEEKEAERKCKVEAERGDETGASSSEASGVKKVVMDPGCTCCTQAKTICEFLVDSNKKWVACIWCNQSKGKCWWPGDGKGTKVGPKATTKVNKGKK
ncbi:hypothetical protein F5J12DRAFT_893768 [Pisolithus orientalis]|uniref:uncharacterized protein n=1 Tax=Pisolithus orientalis TaxID=936130 RepID=UPI0022256BAD|nr:uncharacterized protein F5J12DRAFT_893768 [Pisolithus orientalis]KAI6003524.1 hypothetical protein F5J12DRAFT_893768 [Pisolithus orientalis]